MFTNIKFCLLTTYDSLKCPKKMVEPIHRSNPIDDLLVDLVKVLYDLYLKPVQVEWYGIAFGVHNDDFLFFIEFNDVNEIISDNQFLNITIL